MSDGSLSQDEIDALLQGTDGVDFGESSGGGSGSDISENERSSLEGIVQESSSSQASNLSMLVGKSVSIDNPTVETSNKESFLQDMPEELVEIKLDFSEGISGDHLFIMTSETATKIAALMMGQEGVELNDAAYQALQEGVSQITGPVITSVSDKTGQNVMADTPQSQYVPKAMVQLPHGNFVKVTHPVKIEGEEPMEMYEIYSQSIANDIAQYTGAQGQQGQGGLDQQGVDPSQMGFGVSGQQQGSQMGGMQQGGMQQGGMQQGGQMGGMQQGGMQGGYSPNVQQVQFPGLQGGGQSHESGNIGLLMDVYMEMTVELGRTRKLIKDILGMGEGTIIELDKLAGEPVDILVNHKLIAKGEVVVIDENFGVRVTEIVSPSERINEMT